MKNYYNKVFAEHYDNWTKNGYYDYEKEAIEFDKIAAGKNTLELGIGTGCLAEELIKLGYQIEAIEPSKHMIKKLNEKKLGIKVYKQDAINLNTDRRYNTVFSHGAVPGGILRKNNIYFDTYIENDFNFYLAMKKTFQHLKNKGLFLVGCQSGNLENFSLGNFYKNKATIKGNKLVKTHFFKRNGGWESETVTTRIWPEKEFIQLMEEVGFKTIGLNKSKTWYVFQK